LIKAIPGYPVFIQSCISAVKFSLGVSPILQDEVSEDTGKQRRESARVPLGYPTRLNGIDGEGRPFVEETLLDNLSSDGLYLRLSRSLTPGSSVSVAVRLSSGSTPAADGFSLAAEGTILRAEPQQDGSYGTAVGFKQKRIL
jgi:hypothetical protein